MAANSWQSALPSAWKPQDPNTQVMAGKLGAETAGAAASAAQTAVTTEAANQERIRKQALQDVMAKSIKTTMGPNGKLIHVFDNDRFMEQVAQSPAAMDAYDKYQATIYPQAGKEAVQRGVRLDNTGAVDAKGTLQEAARSPYGLDIVSAAQGLQLGQAKTGTEIAGAKVATGAITEPGTAAPGTLMGNQQMQPRDLTGAGGSAGVVTPEQISTLSRDARSNALYQLQQQGIALPATATDAEIAGAVNKLADIEVKASYGEGKVGEFGSTALNSAFTADKRRQEVASKILRGDLDTQAKRIGVQRSGIETEGLAEGVATVKSVARTLLIPDSKLGDPTDKEVQERVRKAESAVNALGQLKTNIKSLMTQIDSGKLNPNSVEGNKALSADLIAQVSLLSRVYGGTNTEGGIQRAMEDVGAPRDIAADAVHGGIEKGVAAWLSNKATDITGVLRDAPKRAAQSVQSVLSDARSSDPDKVLRNAGHGDLLGLKQHLKPAGKTGAGKYKTTKINAAGMHMGQKADGTWEPIK